MSDVQAAIGAAVHRGLMPYMMTLADALGYDQETYDGMLASVTAEVLSFMPVKWALGLVNDGEFEYMNSADCDGSNPYWMRRLPAREPIEYPGGGWYPTTKGAFDNAWSMTICAACNGNGLVSSMHYDGSETTFECSDCHGDGLKHERRSIRPNGDASV